MSDRSPEPGSPWATHCPDAWPREWLDERRELPPGFARPATPLEADLITGRDSELVRLPWVGHRSPAWEPEPLRWLGLNAGLRVMGVADREEVRTGRPSRAAAFMGRFLGE